MPLERYLADKAGAFNGKDYYRIYQLAAADILSKKIVVSDNPQIGITLHKEDEKKYIVCAINFSDTTQDTYLKVKKGWKLISIWGEMNQNTKCNGAIYYAVKK